MPVTKFSCCLWKSFLAAYDRVYFAAYDSFLAAYDGVFLLPITEFSCCPCYSLHLKEEAHDFLETASLTNLVKKYSQFINFNIYLWSSKVCRQPCVRVCACVHASVYVSYLWPWPLDNIKWWFVVPSVTVHGLCLCFSCCRVCVFLCVMPFYSLGLFLQCFFSPGAC